MTTELTRIRLDVSAVSDIMFANIPEWIWESDFTTFLDPSMGAGQFLYEIKKKLLSYGHSEDNIASRLFGYATDFFALQYGINRFELRGEFITGNILEANLTRKFNVIIGNPPYQGKAALHQQFFNMAVDAIIDGGIVCFIQPATPYVNKKDVLKAPEIAMKKNVTKYRATVRITNEDLFGGLNLHDLAITTLTKLPGNGKLNKVVYDGGIVHENVDIADVNKLRLSPEVYSSIRNKYKKMISKNGSLHTISSQSVKSSKLPKAYMQSVRGHSGTDDFFTLVSNDPSYYGVRDDKDFGVYVELDEMPSLYSYLKTFFARFGLALSKFNGNNHMGELRTVPLVPFDRNWTDEELAELIGLTDEELNIIRTVLSDYHGLLK
jgi:hypothetical protein